MYSTASKYILAAALSLAVSAETAQAQSSEQTAQITQQDSASRKINLAGRQRMLSQHIAKSVCFAESGVLPAEHRAMVEQAAQLFTSTLLVLREGDETAGVLPETDTEILGALQEAEQIWSPMNETLTIWLTGQGMEAGGIEVIYESNIPLLQASHRVVEMMEASYGAGAVLSSYKAAAVNVSGRQRMLSQKMSKEFCLAHAGYQTEANLAALSETKYSFETAHKALLYGDAAFGLAESAPYAIRQQLEFAIARYSEMEPALGELGEQVSPADLISVASMNLTVLAEIDKAVKMFEDM